MPEGVIRACATALLIFGSSVLVAYIVYEIHNGRVFARKREPGETP